MIVYVGIGNSDDKLPQRDWVLFQLDTRQAIKDAAGYVIGDWHSFPDSIFQNACICFDLDDDKAPELKGTLAAIATQYRQDSIAWAVADTQMLRGQGRR